MRPKLVSLWEEETRTHGETPEVHVHRGATMLRGSKRVAICKQVQGLRGNWPSQHFVSCLVWKLILGTPVYSWISLPSVSEETHFGFSSSLPLPYFSHQSSHCGASPFCPNHCDPPGWGSVLGRLSGAGSLVTDCCSGVCSLLFLLSGSQHGMLMAQANLVYRQWQLSSTLLWGPIS